MDDAECMELIAEVNRLRFSGKSKEAIALLEPRLSDMDLRAQVFSYMQLIYAAEEGGLSHESMKFATALEAISPGAPCARRVLERNRN